MANKTLNNVKINMTLKSTTTRAKLSTSSEDLAVQLGKINKWYDSLVPTGGASGNILGWNSDGTAKWVTVAPSANKLNVSSAVGGTSQPVYFKADGTPETISFTIEKSVPSSAVFTDEKVKSTLLTQSTAAASYRPTFVTGAATGGVSIINSYQVSHTPGTTSAVGNTRLVLGNSTASGTTNNEEGQIKLYSPGTALHTIKGVTISSEAVHVLPSTGGTILNDQTTSYTQTVASSATGAYEIGKIKINGTSTTIYGKDTGTSYGISGAYGTNNNTWVTTITAGGSGTTSTVPTASTSAYGITKLYNGVDSTSTGLAATANAVKTAYDKANHSHPYLPLAGGTLTGRVTTAKFLNYIVKGTGTAGADKGSGQNPRYVPAKWTFDTGQTVSDGDIIFIKIPVAGHDYGVYISIDNGATYHPAVISGSSRLTTHYSNGNYAAFTYRSDGSAASMIPLAGNTDGARATVTGGVWQGIDYYDSGNTYDRTSQQTRIYAGGVGVFRYSICALNNAQRMESFTTTGDASGSPTTTKTFNTSAKFAYPPVIMYNNANAAYSSGSVIGNNVLYEQHPSVDMRYSCNKTSSASTGFAQYKPVFIECTFDDNGYFSITSNGFVQTFTSGKYYIFVGCMYNTSVYQLALFAQHPLYYYDGTHLRYMPPPHTHSEYLPLSGGTLTGPLTLKNDQYGENYGLDCTNSNIIGVNAIRFADSSEMYTEGISFARSTSGYWDTIWANNGEFYFTPNHQTDVTGATSYKVLHTNNTSFSRSLTSGTKIGTITIAGTATDIYAPSASTVNNASLTLKGAGTTVTTFTANASTNQSLDIVAGSNVTITPDATNHKITIASSPDELISKTLTAATFDSTSGNFFFKGNSLFGGTDNFDWVGIQSDASNDKFQLVAGGANGVFYRENDDVWGQWHSLMTNNMILGSSGITVTPNTVTIGGDDGTTINSGVTISHSNSIDAETDTVFKKFSYDANGHITGIANVAAADIPDLNYVKTFLSTNYNINQPGYYAVMANKSDGNPDIDLPTANQWWHVLSMSYSGNTGDVTNWMSQLAIPTYQSKLKGLYWRTNSAANTALTADDWKRVYCEERMAPSTETTKTRNILHLYGSTVGNTASELISGTAGVLSYGDAGPQINFSTNSTIGSAQDSAIIWTDNDTAAAGASWHFVSSQSDWNVISKRFHARTGISIGTNLPQTNYNLYVNGTAFHSDTITFGTSTSSVSPALSIYTRAISTYNTVVKWSNGETWGTRGAEIGYHNTGGDSTNPGTICILPYQTDSNPWDGQVGLFIKKDHVYIDGVELSKTDSKVTQTATTTDADYEVLFSATADNTTRTETARKNSNLKFNPSTGMLNADRMTLTSATWGGLIINRTASGSHAGIIFQQNGTELGAISMGEADSPLIRWKAGSSTSYKVYDEGNVQPMLWRYVPSGDPGSATDAGVYPAYTAAYMQGTGAFGGSTGRLGNSGTTYWAHYLTFTHNSSFRYILRFPFWGPPQFQHTNNDTDQKWSNFITDEHVGNYSRCMGTGTAIDPITGAMTHMHRSNKLAFPPAANITVQISNDSGSTWSNLSVTDTLKRQIFSLPGRSSGVKIGPTSGNATTAMQTRIIFECDGRDVVLNRFLFGIGSDYHTIAIDVYAGSTLSGLTKIATGDASGTWAYEAVATIDNIPSKYYRFSTSNYKFFAFVFRYVTVDSSHLTNRGSVNSIAGFSGIFWGSNGKSNLANYDHMYSWDVDQNVDFPADVAGNSLSAPTVNVSTSSYKASVTASGLTQNRSIAIGDVSGDVGIVKVLHDNANYAAGQTVAITTAEKFKYFIVTIKPNNTFGEKTEIIRITQDTSISTKYISFTGGIGPAPSQPTITLGGYITHQYNTTSKTYTIGAGHAANYILCNNNVSSVSADSITLAITKIVGLA